jgi:hypothetical protein
LEVKSGALTIVYPHNSQEDHWYIRGTIRVRNIGPSRAYIVRTNAELVVSRPDEPLPKFNEHRVIRFPDQIIDASDTFLDVPVCFFPYIVTDANRHETMLIRHLAEDLYESRKIIRSYGFIEYETMGIVWRRNFGYVWNSINTRESPVPEFLVDGPMTDEQRVTNGFWDSDPEKDRPEQEVTDENPQNPN